MKRAALALILALGVTGRVGAEPIELTAAVQDHVREIHARNPDLRDDAFSKMGGSSVASKAFLYCFATPYVDLAEHQHLAGTVDYFNTGRHSSFNRESEAAGVSWNLRYVLGGRPANFRQELEDTQARWAFVLFGGNDAQNENERVYLTRLVYLIEQLEKMGVVPVLGSALPRRNAYRDRWIRRFNVITEAVAEHWSLPYIDYHAAMRTLPRKGFLYRSFLNEGMRAGIPDPATRARTITLYLDKSTFRKALDIQHERSMWVYLFDKKGEVLWRIEGRFSEDKGQALHSLLSRT